MLLLKLNKVEGFSRYRDGDDEGEQATERTRSVLINADAIRNFQPRRENKPGSRLTFVDGGGYAVLETTQQIIEMLAPDAVRSAEVVQTIGSA